MGLINDAAVCCWLLLAHWCQVMPIFSQLTFLAIVIKLALISLGFVPDLASSCH
jgi:hypothetical protein